MLAWNLFLEIVSRSGTVFIDECEMMKKMQFPWISLPAKIAIVALVNNLGLFVIVMIVAAIAGHFSATAILFYPFLALLTATFSAGIGLALGVLNVFIRDVGHGIPILLQLGFWFTPIVYPVSIVPEGVRTVLQLNPVFHFVEAYHDVLLYGRVPDLLHLAVLVSLAFAAARAGLSLLRRARGEMVDVL